MGAGSADGPSAQLAQQAHFFLGSNFHNCSRFRAQCGRDVRAPSFE